MGPTRPRRSPVHLDELSHVKDPTWAVAAVIAVVSSLLAHSQSPVHSTPIELIYGKPFINVSIDRHGPFRLVVLSPSSELDFHLIPEVTRTKGLNRVSEGVNGESENRATF